MLYITVVHDRSNEDEVFNPGSFFDDVYEPDWIDNEFSRLVIRDIDKSEVVAGRIIDSPYLGYVDPTHLSGGAKCVLLLAFYKTNKWKFNISACGDNCMKWIQIISKVQDLHVYLSHLPLFDQSSYFEIKIENTGKICRNQDDIFEMWTEVK